MLVCIAVWKADMENPSVVLVLICMLTGLLKMDYHTVF